MNVKNSLPDNSHTSSSNVKNKTQEVATLEQKMENLQSSLKIAKEAVLLTQKECGEKVEKVTANKKKAIADMKNDVKQDHRAQVTD